MKDYHPITIAECIDLIEQALLSADVFFGHGTNNATDEAIRLIWYCLKLPIDSDNGVLQNIVTRCQYSCVQDMLSARISHNIPLAYLTHEAWFMGLSFYVDERVLIPRSPFAELISKRFRPWIDPGQVNNILEIGTGSGCMAIAAAMIFADVQVDAVDISQDALDVAQRNVNDYALEERVKLICSDCYEQLSAGKYDIIMSNPPYVSSYDMQQLPAEYGCEPNLALQAAQDGLAIVTTILQKAINFLRPHGILVVEVGCSQEALMAAFPQVPFVWLEFSEGGEGVFLLDYAALELL